MMVRTCFPALQMATEMAIEVAGSVVFMELRIMLSNLKWSRKLTRIFQFLAGIESLALF